MGPRGRWGRFRRGDGALLLARPRLLFKDCPWCPLQPCFPSRAQALSPQYLRQLDLTLTSELDPEGPGLSPGKPSRRRHTWFRRFRLPLGTRRDSPSLARPPLSDVTQHYVIPLCN